MTTEEKRQRKVQTIEHNLEYLKVQLDVIKEEQEKYNRKIELLNSVDCFTKEDTKNILEYLVSAVEEKPYSVETMHLNVKTSTYHVENMVLQYTLLYLVSDEEKEKAIKEIKDNYGITTINNEYYMSNKSEEDGESYTKLSLYNRHVNRYVKFDEGNDHISININNDKYNYIYDFIEEIIDARLDSPTCSINNERIRVMADNFALKQKYKRKLILESE